MDSETRKKHSFSQKLTIISIIVLLIFVGVVVGQVIRGHDEAQEKAKQLAERLVRIQSNNIEMTLSAVNLSLQGLANNKYYGSLLGEEGQKQFNHNIESWVKNYTYISWVLVSDKDGKIMLIGSKKEYESWAQKKTQINEAEFFQRHRINKTDTDEVIISIEKSALGKKQDLIIISRPIYSFDGSFSGVAAAAIDPSFFFHFVSSIESAGKTEMAILVNNKEFLNSNRESAEAKEISQMLSRNEPNKAAGKEVQFYKVPNGNNKYLVAYRELASMPVKIAVSVDENWAMTSWKSMGMVNLVFLALFIIFGGVLFTLVMAMSKQIMRSEQSEKNALLANQAKSEFLAKMSHELRTPLNAIIGFSEMIDNGYFGPIPNRKQQERIHDINLCGNHLLNLINDILDYTKGEAGKLEIHDGEVSLDKVVDESIRILNDKARRKKITISVDIPNGLPKLKADERKLKQILLNLISNAIKFTAANGRVLVAAAVNSGGEIEIYVQDNGIGIAREDIPVALSVFGQVRGRQQTDEEGTGLGLPLCKMLVEMHDAKFEIESEVGSGTKVIITMPKERVLGTEKKPTKKKSNPAN